MSEIYLNESVILLDLAGNTKDEILTAMSSNLQELGLVKETFKEAVIAREKEYATGLPTMGVSVAIPHTDPEHVMNKAISVAVLKETVDFGVMGGDESETTPVKLVFMMAMDEADSQLGLLQKLMQIFQDEEILLSLANEKNESKIVELLKSKLGLSPEGGGR